MRRSAADPNLAGPEDRLGLVIKRAEQVMIATKTRALRPFGLTVPQYAAMYALAMQPGSSGARLARECQVTPQAMASVLSNLEAKGLVERRPSDDHAQVLVTRLSPAGHTLLCEADQVAADIEHRVSEAFDPGEAVALRELLERAILAFEETAHPPAPGGPDGATDADPADVDR